MRKLLLGLLVLLGAILTGLLLASLLLQEECRDCGGKTKYFAENPGQCVDGPAILDCPRCGDSGRISLLNGRLGKKPDPLIASLLRHSYRGGARTSEQDRRDFEARVEQSGLKSVVGKVDLGGSGRFVRDQGRCYLLFLQQATEGSGNELIARVFLFSDQGTLLDAVRLSTFGSMSHPAPSFVIPARPGGPCARIRLLVWENLPHKGVEIRHAGKVWKGKPGEPHEKLGLQQWAVHLENGRLAVRDAEGKSVPE